MAWCILSGSIAFDEMRGPAVAFEEFLKLGLRDAGEDRGIGDFVAVEVEDRQDRAVGGGVEEFIGVPGGGKRAGFGFTVADDAGDDQVGIVEYGAEGVADRISEFTAFVDRAGTFGRDVAGNPAGE